MQVHDDKSHNLISAALLAIVVALAGLAGAVKIAQSAVDLRPAVGDIVKFEPDGYLPRDLHTQVTVARVGQGECVLDLEALHRNGGSLVVEQRSLATDSHYIVHWAGGRTADGPQNCGATADLRLDDSNLDLLAMAAGGWGVTHEHLTASSLWNRSANAKQ